MIHLQNVTKVFGTGVTGLADINLEIDKGEFVFLVGKTGSGKTTLLKLLIRETLPTTGDIMIGEWDIVGLPEKSIPLLRKKVGVIFQDLKLLMDRTIGENILLPLQVAGRAAQDAANRVSELLEEVGMSEHKEKFPIQLSGGELQRVAIARALALSPEILLADEPTGNLDEATAFDIVDLLSRINSHGTTIIMATHNMDIVKKLHHRVVGLDSGKMVGDTKKSSKPQETTHKHEDKDEKEEVKEEKKDHDDKKEKEEGKTKE
ncbi:MAG TPA: ATP-binding cassette domain-containing protein [Candidatus Eisenbacteria bacterium]|nr:ATP-binding cassette domain-containing protein [Candidatus Eisenbacteria bacterium]